MQEPYFMVMLLPSPLKMKKKQNDEKLFSVDDRIEETLLPEGNPDDNTVIVSASSLLFMELDVLNRFMKK